jgi:hypothetical protein
MKTVCPSDPDSPQGVIELGPRPLILLGAGASVEAGIPATVEMTKEIVARIGQSSHHTQMAQALNFVCGALVAYDSAEGASPYAGLDVERVIAAVELLAERRTLEVSPFVSSWHPAVDVWDRQPSPSFFDSNFQKSLLGNIGPSLQQLIEQLIDARTGIGSGETYSALQRRMIDELCGIVTDPKDLGYLRPLANAARAHPGLWVATLNYDLTVERACQMYDASVYTGIQDWIANRAWNWTTAADLKLLKLHGSIDWRWSQDKDQPGHLPIATVTHTDEVGTDQGPPVVLFGQRGKLREEGPFLSLLAEFEMALTEVSRLIVIGYSFRDPHINTVIRRWTRGDLTRTIAVVDPNFPDDPWQQDDDFRTELLAHLKPPSWKSDTSFLDRLDVRRVKASEALAEMAWS